MPHADWNVVITTAMGPGAFRAVREKLAQFGEIDRTDYWNVLVLRVNDVFQFLEDIDAVVTADPSLASAISRVIPVTRTFHFQSPEEFEANACQIAREWIADLKDTCFHVRMHRRGFKGRISSQSEERFLDRFILDALEADQSSAQIGFEDPDYIIDVESVGQQGGMSLWSRDDLKKYRLLKLD